MDRSDEHFRLLLASLEDWKPTILAKGGLYWALSLRRISEYSCTNEWKTRDMASTVLLIGPWMVGNTSLLLMIVLGCEDR